MAVLRALARWLPGILLIAAISCSGSPDPAGVGRVWALSDGEKIRRDDLSSPFARPEHNTVWDGKRIRLFAARNEIVAFQLIVEAGKEGLSSVRVRLDSLVRGGYVLRNTSQNPAFGDYRGRRIEGFLEQYIEVTERSSHSSIWSRGARPSSYYKGPIPDGLVPLGSRGFPVPAGTNQGVWFDIYVPRQAPAGVYTGDVTISRDTLPDLRVPVLLHVFDFELSDTTHLHNMFVAQQLDIAERHGVPLFSPAYYALEREYYKAAHRHRMDLNFLQTLDSLDLHAQGYYTGSWYTEKEGYDGPGAGVGNMTYGIGVYDQPDGGEKSGFAPATEVGWRKASDGWVTWFAVHAPSVEIFRFMTDLPDISQYAQIRERAGWIHENPGPGRRLKTLCTVRIDPQLFGAIDIWALSGPSGSAGRDGIPLGFTVVKVRERKEAGEKIALYNGTRPGSGTLEIIDTEAADARVNPWIAWRYNVDLYFLWEVNQYRDGERRMNPWVDQYIVLEEGKVWGSGTILYPGEDKVYTAADRGLRGPIASIRMKNWRRGEQDYEYLWLARSLGLEQQLRPLVASIVPAAFDECPDGQNSPPPWALRGEQYEAARDSLATLIEDALQNRRRDR